MLYKLGLKKSNRYSFLLIVVYFGNCFYTQPFIPQIFIEHVLCTKQSARYRAEWQATYVLSLLLLLQSWCCGCKTPVNHKGTRYHQRVSGNLEPEGHYYHTGQAQMWVLFGTVGANCEDANREGGTAPHPGGHEHAVSVAEVCTRDPPTGLQPKGVNNTQQHSLFISLFIYFNTKLWH